MRKQLLAVLFMPILFLAMPFNRIHAEENGDGASSLIDGPLMIIAVATIVIMIYYMFRD
ncbi:hypothetical protein [Texcoconibacillus texcoconensis]|uniref:Uncharacterized protein n=1 Tax=Texcoconibacillus texcoconensis TaxID=1095777 RepID=A0A840QSJ8_9BACI|nr:hypothetical protein [Texcoconibacillus texcoconensis]MBB5174496.1 hypothetical protein [Texcoconibacillus texcoconensis]